MGRLTRHPEPMRTRHPSVKPPTASPPSPPSSTRHPRPRPQPQRTTILQMPRRTRDRQRARAHRRRPARDRRPHRRPDGCAPWLTRPHRPRQRLPRLGHHRVAHPRVREGDRARGARSASSGRRRPTRSRWPTSCRTRLRHRRRRRARARCSCRRSCARAPHADGGSAYINKLLTARPRGPRRSRRSSRPRWRPLLSLLYGARSHSEILRARDRLRMLVPAADLLLRPLHAARRGAQRPAQLRAVHLGARAQQRRRASSASSCSRLLFGFDPDGYAHRRRLDARRMIALLAGSATLGVAVQALVLFWFWRRIGLRYRPDFAWRGVGLGSAGRMAGWTFGMLLLTTFAGIVRDPGRGCRPRARDASVAALDNAWLDLHAAALGDHGLDRDRVLHAHERARARPDALDRVRDDVSCAIRGISAHHRARGRRADGRRLPVRRGLQPRSRPCRRRSAT